MWMKERSRQWNLGRRDFSPRPSTFISNLSGNVEDRNGIGYRTDDSFPKSPNVAEKNWVSVIRIPGSWRIRRGRGRDIHGRWLLFFEGDCEHLCKPTNARVYSNDPGSQKLLDIREIKFRTLSLSTLSLCYPNIQKTCPGRFSQWGTTDCIDV